MGILQEFLRNNELIKEDAYNRNLRRLGKSPYDSSFDYDRLRKYFEDFEKVPAAFFVVSIWSSKYDVNVKDACLILGKQRYFFYDNKKKLKGISPDIIREFESLYLPLADSLFAKIKR